MINRPKFSIFLKANINLRFIASESKRTNRAEKIIISPKIVINKKNYVFKEAIDQLNSERQNTRKISIERKKLKNNEIKYQNQRVPTELQIHRQWSDVHAPSFNPFETAEAVEINQESNRHDKYVDLRSKSDVCIGKDFLNRIESTNDSKIGRRSDLVHHNNHYYSKPIKQFQNYYASIVDTSNSKLSNDTGSNKEISGNNSSSVLSYASNGEKKEYSRKNIMMHMVKGQSNELIPSYTEDVNSMIKRIPYYNF